MNRTRHFISLALVFALASVGLTAQAQRTTTRYTRYQISQIISRVESDASRFGSTFNSAVNDSDIDNTNRERNGDIYVNDLATAIGQLRDRNYRRAATTADVQLVLDRATLVDNFLRRNQIGGQTDTDWAAVRADLNELATAYGLRWRGTATNRNYPRNGTYGNNPTYGNNGYGNNGFDARLTGTYRLDASRSDDPRTEAARATRTLPYGTRQSSYDQLLARLTAPDTLAIERRGTQVTIASTRAPQFTLVADGTERVEQTPNGRTVRARASLSGDQLIISTTGDRDNDFNVTFAPIDNGRSLEVTRRLSDVNLRTPVTVRSVYTRSADVAQFDIYHGGGNQTGAYNPNGTNYPTTASGAFIVPDGTTLIATLDNDLSTSNTREGENFSMTVNQPGEFSGARIDGHISQVSRGGRVSGRSGMTFNFDRITLRDGRAYSFSGFVDSVRSTNGETVRVDNEGTVQENDSRTTQTAQRAAIGTAVGAIIGAIASGGKGAAIGAILGAGAGAGSVYVQGRDDLELMRGSEVTIRASSPRNVSR
jgi:hypothetical protein